MFPLIILLSSYESVFSLSTHSQDNETSYNLTSLDSLQLVLK